MTSVRRAGPDDLDALVATRVALFRELGQADAAGTSAFAISVRATLERMLADGSALAWIATEAAPSATSGACVLLVFPRLPSPLNLATREGYLLNVWVAEAQRRRGIATALVEAALAEARRLALGRIRLHATPAGRAVYERLGFHLRSDEMELSLESER